MSEVQTNSALAARLKDVVKWSGKSIEDFAVSIGVDRGQFGKVLNGKMGITLKQVLEISSRYNVRTGWLLEGEGAVYKTEKSGPIQEPDQNLLTQISKSLMTHTAYVNQLLASYHRQKSTLGAIPDLTEEETKALADSRDKNSKAEAVTLYSKKPKDNSQKKGS